MNRIAGAFSMGLHSSLVVSSVGRLHSIVIFSSIYVPIGLVNENTEPEEK